MRIDTGEVYPSRDAAIAAGAPPNRIVSVSKDARLARMAKEPKTPRRKAPTKNQRKRERQKLRSWGRGRKK